MKKNQTKQWIGTLLLVCGILALIFSYFIRNRVGEERGKVDTFITPLSQTGQVGRMAGEIVGERADEEAARYLQNAQLLMVGGIVLVVGGVILILLRKK